MTAINFCTFFTIGNYRKQFLFLHFIPGDGCSDTPDPSIEPNPGSSILVTTESEMSEVKPATECTIMYERYYM